MNRVVSTTFIGRQHVELYFDVGSHLPGPVVVAFEFVYFNSGLKSERLFTQARLRKSTIFVVTYRLK